MLLFHILAGSFAISLFFVLSANVSSGQTVKIARVYLVEISPAARLEMNACKHKTVCQITMWERGVRVRRPATRQKHKLKPQRKGTASKNNE